MPNMTKVYYVGDSVAPVHYRGQVSQKSYRFGGPRHQENNVDERDVPGLLSIREGGRDVFSTSARASKKSAKESEPLDIQKLMADLSPEQRVSAESAIAAHLGPRPDDAEKAAIIAHIAAATSPEADASVAPGSYGKTGTRDDALRRAEIEKPEHEAIEEAREERRENAEKTLEAHNEKVAEARAETPPATVASSDRPRSKAAAKKTEDK